ncbi:hypothetical protein [Demequina phytophila]|uniref:hypothetical protein n=1 Tax=Demequina phytophila TaxID=1638981 RepID=UPI0007842480|nr:hypothetical protein [Demequina phytophila]
MARIVWSLLVIALIGVIVALVGAGSHRAFGWISVAACLLLVGTASVFSRAWRGFLGLTVFATAWLVLTVVLAQEGPGGSLLIPNDARSLAWVYGGAVVIGVAALVPRRFIGDSGVPTGDDAPHESEAAVQ